MRIIKTKALKSKKFICLLIREFLAPWKIKNASLFILCDKGESLSFCTIKSWGNLFELSNVVTPKKFRKKGYSTRLLKRVLKNYGEIYLICETKFENFYNRFGFGKIRKVSFPLRKLLAFNNFFRIFGGKRYIVMGKNNYFLDSSFSFDLKINPANVKNLRANSTITMNAI